MKRLPPSATELPIIDASTTKFGDWYGNPVGVGHRKLILCVSERARLPILLPARDVKNVGTHLRQALSQVLAQLEVSDEAITTEIDEMQEVVFAPTASRSVLGSINDYTNAIWFRLYEQPDADLIEVSLWLAETPILALGGDSAIKMARDVLSTENDLIQNS